FFVHPPPCQIISHSRSPLTDILSPIALSFSLSLSLSFSLSLSRSFHLTPSISFFISFCCSLNTGDQISSPKALMLQKVSLGIDGQKIPKHSSEQSMAFLYLSEVVLLGLIVSSFKGFFLFLFKTQIL